ncbi:unnamed protein product, partial [Discosporangium mesarthrocarpum]
MDLLKERQSGNLVSESKVAQLRESLVDVRDALRSETYGPGSRSQRCSPEPPVPATPPVVAAAPAMAKPLGPGIDADEKDTLRRCSALLRADIHGSLTGKDLVALRDSLALSLECISERLRGGKGEVAGPASSPLVAVAAEEMAAPHSDGLDHPVAGMQSVAGIISDMGLDCPPAKFEPEVASGGAKRWVSTELGEEQRKLSSKALGYLVKHKGGKGYGRGRLRGDEAEDMVCTLAELTEMLAEE